MQLQESILHKCMLITRFIWQFKIKATCMFKYWHLVSALCEQVYADNSIYVPPSLEGTHSANMDV